MASATRQAGGAVRILDAMSSAIVDSVVGRIAVLDPQGRITAVNSAWERQSDGRDGLPFSSVGKGKSYLDAWRRLATDGDKYGRDAFVGLLSVLQGASPHFALDYPVEEEAGQRWYSMVASALSETGGAIVTHVDRRRDEAAREAYAAGLGIEPPHESGEMISVLVRSIAAMLSVEQAAVVELVQEDPPICRTFVHWTGDSFAEPFSYDPTGTPCAVVLEAGYSDCLSGVQAQFPEDEWLGEANAESYAGVALFSSTGARIGHLMVVGTQPLSPDAPIETLLRIFAARVSATMEHARSEREKEHLSARLADTETFYQALFDGSLEPILVFSPERRLVQANAAFRDLTGYTADELDGIDITALGADQIHSAELFAEVVAKPEWAGQSRGLRAKDGSVIPTRTRVRRVDLPSGPVFVSIIHDIRPVQEHERQLRDAEIRHAALVDAIPDAIARVDRDGIVLDTRSGIGTDHTYLDENCIGHNITDVAPGKLGTDYMTLVTAALTTGQNQMIQFTVDFEGQARYREARAVPLREEQALLIIRDYTAEKVQAEEAERVARIEQLEGKVEHLMVRRNPYTLTFRELSVLHLVCEGLADKEIAERLGVSIFTVNKHVANILAKMSASSRTEAAVRAAREQLVL